MTKAVIFDMDGLLIDSEPLWREAIVTVLERHGIDLADGRGAETMGLRVDEVIAVRARENPGKIPDEKSVVNGIIDEMAKLYATKDIELPGATEAISFVKEKGLPIALASSTHTKLIDVVIDRFDIRKHLDIIYSAEHEEYGKPHPGVFISTAKLLSVEPDECVVFEDSHPGVIAAKAARMKCICVPNEFSKNHRGMQAADVILGSLLELNDEVWEALHK